LLISLTVALALLAAAAGPATRATAITTQSEAPQAETVGSPIRTATSVRLEGRVDPRGSATDFRFEYGTEGSCDSHPCQSTPVQTAGAGQETRFVSQLVSGLAADTTYHYRLVAENEAGPSEGADRTATTRHSDAPLNHGGLAGPPQSDRAWELVSMPDTDGNPVAAGYAFSDSGDRSIYQVLGGTPIGDSGSNYNELFAERTSSNWLTQWFLPTRQEATGPNWQPPIADPSLSRAFTYDEDFAGGRRAFWELRPGGTPTKLLELSEAEYGGFFAASEDVSRTVVALTGSLDPGHPTSPSAVNLYEVGSGFPRLLSLLPSGDVPACGVVRPTSPFGLPSGPARRADHWVSRDGSLLVFPSRGAECGAPSQLYLRDIDAGATTRISPLPVSGPACSAAFIKSTGNSVFFWTRSRLLVQDSEPAACAGSADGDIYRSDLATESLECVTCIVPGISADVVVAGEREPAETVAVAEDGSRLYFSSWQRLVPGAASPGAYRVDVATGGLAYVAPLEGEDRIGELAAAGSALTPDGTVIVFRSSAPGLNQLGGAQNGGTSQYYRYDDADRSLVCASCPQDGSPPQVAASEFGPSSEAGPNTDPLSDDGDFAFATPVALVGADRNTSPSGGASTAGGDLYEWRDGRLLLVSDGATRWPALAISPLVAGVSPSGSDIFFTASARYTADAVDSVNRLYDARLGGGFQVAQTPPACSAEGCSEPSAPLPEEPNPATDRFSGNGNSRSRMHGHGRRCRKAKSKHHHRAKAPCRKPPRKHKHGR
jgi:hypothetical protein